MDRPSRLAPPSDSDNDSDNGGAVVDNDRWARARAREGGEGEVADRCGNARWP